MLKADRFKSVLETPNIFLWLALAFQSGFINTGGFLACHRFVSHVTGFGTQIGMSLARSDFFIALEMCLAPVSFVVGGVVAGYLIDRKVLDRKEPRIFRALGLHAFVLVIVFTFGELGYFGEFGEPLILQRDFILLFLLCFACGLQNGIFTSLTGGLIRTTHLTGVSTDLGLNLVRIQFFKGSEADLKNLKRTNLIRLLTIIFFSFGAAMGVVIFSQAQYDGFVVPAISSVMIIFYIHKLHYSSSKESLCQKAFQN